MSYDSYIGKTETRTDEVSPRLITGMAATLGVPRPETLPPLWHWMLFQDWVQPGELGPDGHPRRGGFLPPVHDLPRRIWAGGRIQLLAPLHEGERVTRTSTILAVKQKQGGSGKHARPDGRMPLRVPAANGGHSATEYPIAGREAAAYASGSLR